MATPEPDDIQQDHDRWKKIEDLHDQMQLERLIRTVTEQGSAPCGKKWKDVVNVTGNLGKMAEQVGVYNAIWVGDGQVCGEYISALTNAISLLRNNDYSAYNHKYGWGNQVNLYDACRKMLKRFKKHPDWIISSHV